MTGESPVIDTSATRVVQTFKLEQLQSIPNARHVVAAGGHAGGSDDPHRCRRQPCRDADGYRAYGFDGRSVC